MWFFKDRGEPDVEQLLADLTKRDDERRRARLFKHLRTLEVYSTVTNADRDWVPGSNRHLREGERVDLLSTKSPWGGYMFAIYTWRLHPGLGERFIGLTIQDAFELALDDTRIDSIIIQGRTEFYPLNRAEIVTFLAKYII